MSRITKLAVLAALPVAALSLCALAQTADPATATNARPSFFAHMLKKMDTNGDGKISLDEYLAAATTRFQSIDSQNKGSIDATQIAQSPRMQKRAEMVANFMVKRLDTAGNGYVTKDEYLAAAKTRFAKLDTKGDGKLTVDELNAEHGFRHHGQPAADGNERRTAAIQKIFDKLDANHDGVVTQDEFLAQAGTKFAAIDAQGNGKVTAAELANSPEALKREQRVAEHVIKRLDSNADGVVSQDEFLAAAKVRFGKIDKNADGYIEADEVGARHWAHGHRPDPANG